MAVSRNKSGKNQRELKNDDRGVGACWTFGPDFFTSGMTCRLNEYVKPDGKGIENNSGGCGRFIKKEMQ